MVKILHVSPNLFIPPLHWDLILSYLSRECFGPNTSFAMPRKSRAMLSFQSDNMTMWYTYDDHTQNKVKTVADECDIHPSLYSISNENVRGIYKLTTWYACPCVAASIYSKKSLCEPFSSKHGRLDQQARILGLISIDKKSNAFNSSIVFSENNCFSLDC